MAIVETDVKHYASLNMPSDDTSISGGATSAVEIDDTSFGQLFPTMPIDPVSTTTWYYKTFFANTNITNNAYKVRFYMRNALISIVAAGTVSLVSTSEDDDDTVIAKIIGQNELGVETYENVALNGTFPVNSLLSFSVVHHVELFNSTGISLYANGDITISRGIQLGIIPTGDHGATSEIYMAISPSVDDSLSVANRLTPPNDGGATPVALTFYRPNTEVTSLPCTGASQNLLATEGQGIWFKWVQHPGSYPCVEMPIDIRCSCYTVDPS